MADFPDLHAAYVVKLEDDSVSLPAICARVRTKKAIDESPIALEVPPLIDIAPSVMYRPVATVVSFTVLPLARLAIRA